MDSTSVEVGKDLNTYFQIEFMMKFLMRLNETFNLIRTHLLLIDPEPEIFTTFSYVVQDIEKKNDSYILKLKW